MKGLHMIGNSMNTWKAGAIAVLILLLIPGILFCYGCGSTETETPTRIIEDITAAEANDLIAENKDNPDFKIIDVRTPEEYAEGYIENSVLIDINGDDFEEKIGKLDRDGTYLVYCRSGNRSGRAVDIMRELGFREVYNMLGGIGAWTVAGLPTVK